MTVKMECSHCGFLAWDDYKLMENHSCEVEQNGGRCEDYPCCGHEAGDCNGKRYGSDEKIKADVYRAMTDPDFEYRMEQQSLYEDLYGY